MRFAESRTKALRILAIASAIALVIGCLSLTACGSSSKSSSSSSSSSVASSSSPSSPRSDGGSSGGSGGSPGRSQLNPDASLTEQPMPSNGEILNGSSYGDAGVGVTASNTDAYVKVKDSSGTVVGFFVRSGQTAEAYFAPGTYDVQFAMGTTWYGLDHLFGSKTSYGQDRGVTLGYGELMSYDLRLSASGNFSMDSLSGSDF